MSEKDRRALRGGGLGVGVIVLIMVVVFPVLDYWDSLDKKARAAEKKLTQIQAGLDDAVENAKGAKELRDRVTLYPDATAVNRQTALMLEQIEKLPSYRKLTIQRLEGQPLRQDDPLYKSSVQLQFAGNLNDLHQVLHEMESAKPLLKVERLNLTTGRKEEGRVEGQMVVAAYAVSAKKRTNG